jgi:alcohol/geraniol dehydrogenase (NADP+)
VGDEIAGALDPASAGPLFCGGITVFGPIADFGVKPTDRVGVVGIGGLGHLALQFLNKWGCEVTALHLQRGQSGRRAQTRRASRGVQPRFRCLAKLAGSLDFILVTANVTLDWDALSPHSRRTDGCTSWGGARTGAGARLRADRRAQVGIRLAARIPATVATMLDFCARHHRAGHGNLPDG